MPSSRLGFGEVGNANWKVVCQKRLGRIKPACSKHATLTHESTIRQFKLWWSPTPVDGLRQGGDGSFATDVCGVLPSLCSNHRNLVRVEDFSAMLLQYGSHGPSLGPTGKSSTCDERRDKLAD